MITAEKARLIASTPNEYLTQKTDQLLTGQASAIDVAFQRVIAGVNPAESTIFQQETSECEKG